MVLNLWPSSPLKKWESQSSLHWKSPTSKTFSKPRLPLPICSPSTNLKDQSPIKERIMNSHSYCAGLSSPKTNSTSTKSKFWSLKNQLFSSEWWAKPFGKIQGHLLSQEMLLLTMVGVGYGLGLKYSSNSQRQRMNSWRGMKLWWWWIEKMGKSSGRSMIGMQGSLSTQCWQKTTENGCPTFSSRKKMIPFSGWIDPYLL